MLLTLALIVQIYSTVHGYKEIGNNRIEVTLNGTCVAYKEKVSKNWAVAKGCHMYCLSSSNESVAVKFPDERLCTVQLSQSGEYSPLTITGKCYNATCMTPELAPMPTKPELFCSPPETKLYKEENIAVECTQFCFDKTSPRLTYERKKYNVTNGVKCLGKNGKVGTCQNGRCSGQYKEEDCKRKMLAVYSRTNVVATCTLQCNNNSNIPVENGAMCALRIQTKSSLLSWLWSAEKFVEEIGICHNGTCVHREKYNSQEVSPNGCQGTDIVINENLTVASPCTALCKDGTTVPRNESALCLYTVLSSKRIMIFTMLGNVIVESASLDDDYFVVTSRGNPNRL
uniref:Putative secreted protein n=1 Tax=Ixodes ricinus TaxID=34613 RepID=V5GLT1_IXORI